jgi:hypothetical protein
MTIKSYSLYRATIEPQCLVRMAKEVALRVSPLWGMTVERAWIACDGMQN